MIRHNLIQKFDYTELPNGLRIISEYIPYVRSVSAGLWVEAGSRDEKDKKGITHFIEHLVFKGTKTRSAKRIAYEFDSFGAEVNAFTGKENCCFYINFLDDYLDRATEILFDMILNSRFSKRDILSEKNVIKEEIKMHEDTPAEQVHDLFVETLFDGHPLGSPVVGTIDSVEGISREDVLEYYKTMFMPGHMVFAAAGNVKHAQLVEAVEKYFHLPTGSDRKRTAVEPQIKEAQKVVYKETEQVNLCYGTACFSKFSPKRYALGVMANILGGSMSSRLFQEIREKRGLVYSISSIYTLFAETGAVYIYAGARPENVEKVLALIDEETKKIRHRGFRREEVIRSKEHIKGNVVLGLEETSSRMARIGKSLLDRDEILSLNEVLLKIDGVTREDMQSVFEETFGRKETVLTVIGPWQDSVSLGPFQ